MFEFKYCTILQHNISGKRKTECLSGPRISLKDSWILCREEDAKMKKDNMIKEKTK